MESDTRAAVIRRVSWRHQSSNRTGATMTKLNESRTNGKPQKPEKPSPDFPLFPHATGRWTKKIRGSLHYFGPWRDPAGALAKYKRERDDLEAGRTPTPADAEGLTIRDLANRFLTAK